MPTRRRLVRRTGLFIDANLLVLLVVGATGRKLIAKHRRLRTFEEDDYDLLVNLIGPVGRVLVTPHTLAEASNLLAKHGEPEHSQFFCLFRQFIEKSEEISIAGTDASRNRMFVRLGLTDAALLEAISAETPLVTVDLELYLAAVDKDPQSAINFRHLQDRRDARGATVDSH